MSRNLGWVGTIWGDQFVHFPGTRDYRANWARVNTIGAIDDILLWVQNGLSIYDNLALHAIMAGAANDVAIYGVLAPAFSLEGHDGWSPLLDRFVNSQSFGLESVLNVSGGDLKFNLLALLDVNNRRFVRVFAGGNLHANSRTLV